MIHHERAARRQAGGHLPHLGARASLRHRLPLRAHNSAIPPDQSAAQSGIDFHSVLVRGSQYRVESMLLRLARTQDYALPATNKDQVRGQSAIECQARKAAPLLLASHIVLTDSAVECPGAQLRPRGHPLLGPGRTAQRGARGVRSGGCRSRHELIVGGRARLCTLLSRIRLIGL